MICSDRMSENIFHGFSVRQLVNGNMLRKSCVHVVEAVNADDDDGERDCGEDKGSHGHGGSRGDSKTSSHGGQG